MSRILKRPRLPEKVVSTVLVSREYPWLKETLKNYGVIAATTERDNRLPQPVGFHPDLQICPFPFGRMFVLKENPSAAALRSLGISVTETCAEPGDRYPQDVLCGGFVWGNYLVGNPKAIDTAIQKEASQQSLQLLPVRQGYAACSTVLVNERCAITADNGLERALTSYGFEVLLIQPGHIVLPGYDTGFIGGCYGKLSPNELVFTGQLIRHPDGARILDFLENQKVSVIELREGPLVDVGGIVPLLEKDKNE